ncbi:MAG: hypothetical protein MK008_05715 [Bdellovibrionales bacterium]|nr:hypothetical protein [Bdellovibrionales bacterium]
MKLLLLSFIAIHLIGCLEAEHTVSEYGQKSQSSQTSSTVDFDELHKLVQKEREAVMSFDYTPARLSKALRSASLLLVKRLPTPEEEAEAITGLSGYEAVVSSYLESEDFKAVMLEYFQNDFNMAGFVDAVNYNEPANLITYLIVNNEDYRQSITANFCVNDDFEKVECSTFKGNLKAAQEEAAGVLTTQAFLKKWESAFNFIRVREAFARFACRSGQAYPDEQDVGHPVEDISDRVKTFNDRKEGCFNCHKSMNARASLFYRFDRNGFYNLNPSQDPDDGEITVTDTGEVSTIRDLLNDGVEPLYHGKPLKSVRDYAVRFSKKSHFRDCIAQRFTNFALGRSYDEPLPKDLIYLNERVDAHDFKIKPLLLDILKSKRFVMSL